LLFVHLDQDLEDLPDSDRVDLVLDGIGEDPVEDNSPLLVVADGKTALLFETGDPRCQSLPFCNEVDDSLIDLADLVPDGIKGHATWLASAGE
jgi:hypothetical protein